MSPFSEETFLVFDNENFSNSRSMSSLGVVLVRRGEVVGTFRELIQPKDEFMSAYRQGLEIEDAISLEVAWDKLQPWFEEANCYVCFREAVHRTTLVNSFETADIRLPTKPFLCVSSVALTYLKLASHSRDALIAHFGLEWRGVGFKDLNECFATLDILGKLLPLTDCESLQQLIEVRANRREQHHRNYFKMLLPDANFEGIEISFDELTKEDFSDKSFLLTGEFVGFDKRSNLEKIVEGWGGRLIKGVSSKLDIIVFGEGAGPSKIDKVGELQRKGNKIRVVGAEQLLKLID